MMQDYQRIHESPKAAADYAETIPGWYGMRIDRIGEKWYMLSLVWEDEDARKQTKAAG